MRQQVPELASLPPPGPVPFVPLDEAVSVDELVHADSKTKPIATANATPQLVFVFMTSP